MEWNGKCKWYVGILAAQSMVPLVLLSHHRGFMSKFDAAPMQARYYSYIVRYLALQGLTLTHKASLALQDCSHCRQKCDGRNQ